MRPQKGYSRAGFFAENQVPRRQVRSIPDLLGDQTNTAGKIFQGANVRPRITTGGKLIVAAFTGQKGPCASDTPDVIRASVVPLPGPLGATRRSFIRRALRRLRAPV
jgi:hypothetical protein